MNTIRFAISVAVASALCASVGFAQTAKPPAAEGATSPSSASSPQQRESTQTSATESPATAKPSDASTPHQREAMKLASSEQVMKDCMARQSAQNATLSKSDMMKACNDQMKMPKDPGMSKAPANAPEDSIAVSPK